MMSKKINTAGCWNEMFQNGCLVWVNYCEGATTFGGSTEGERFVRLTGERKSKPSKTELLKILKKKGVRPIEFTIPNPFGV